MMLSLKLFGIVIIKLTKIMYGVFAGYQYHNFILSVTTLFYPSHGIEYCCSKHIALPVAKIRKGKISG